MYDMRTQPAHDAGDHPILRHRHRQPLDARRDGGASALAHYTRIHRVA